MIIKRNEDTEETLFSMLARYYELNVSSISSKNIRLHLLRTASLEGRHLLSKQQQPLQPQQQQPQQHAQQESLLLQEVVKFSAQKWLGKTSTTSPGPSPSASPSSLPQSSSSSASSAVLPFSPTMPTGGDSQTTTTTTTTPTTTTTTDTTSMLKPVTTHTTLTPLPTTISLRPIEFEEMMKIAWTACQRILSYLRLESLLLPAVIYMERYVQKLGKTDPSQIFDLFLISTITAIKFWSDSAISNSTFANLFEIPLQLINKNEMKFLNVIGYDLGLSEADVSQFKATLSRFCC